MQGGTSGGLIQYLAFTTEAAGSEYAICSTARAIREQAQNKLLYATIVHFPKSGHWEVQMDVQRRAESFSVTGGIEVAPSRSPLLSYWHWLAFPALAILLFVCNQILKQHLRNRNQSRHGRSNKAQLG